MNEAENNVKKINIKKEWKVAMISTWLIGLLAHAYRFFNFLPIWDTMYNFDGTGATFTSGRWFLEYVGKISTDYDMPWVNGALSLFYLGCIVIMLIEVLEIKEHLWIILTAGLVVTFPSVTSTFAYMFTADGYMLAFLLAMLGVFLTEKYRFGFVAGMLCICLSMSTYQAYLSAALLFVWIICIKHLVIEEKSVWKLIQLEYKQGIAVAGGAVLNKVLTTVVNRLMGVSLVSYQGINDVHLLELEDCIKAISRVQLWFRMFFQIGEQRKDNLYSVFNTGIFVVILILTVVYVVWKKLYKKPLELICLVAAYWCVPMLAYIIRFVSMEVSYHTLMVMCLVMVYVLLILFLANLEKLHINGNITRIIKGISLIVLCGICYYNILNANYAYFNMNLSYEKSYAVSSDILERIEELEGFDGTQPIAITGYYGKETDKFAKITPEIAGAANGIFLRETDHYLAMWDYCMGREYQGASLEQIEQLKETEDYQQMGTYPYANAVRIIDGVVVVKLPEVEEGN